MITRLFKICFIVILLFVASQAQITRPAPNFLGNRLTDPSICSPLIGSLYWNTSSKVFKFCSASNVWTAFGTESSLGDALVANPLSQFASTTSLQLKGVISDETGSGALVFAVSPTFSGTVSGITSAMVGLGNVTNTSDANKPVSTAQQTALDLKANLASPVFTGNTTSGHYKGSGSAPSIVAGAGAGTSPTVSVTGNDFSHQVTVTTGTLPTGTNAVVATITFASAFTGTPRVVFSSANSLSALLSGVSMVSMDGTSSTTYTIVSGTTALTAATSYKWNIIATE